MAANGEAPDYIKNHPALKNIDLSNTGKPSRAPLMVTKTLLFAPEGSNLFAARRLRRKHAARLGQEKRPADPSDGAARDSVPTTYMLNDRQFVVLAVGASRMPAELVALALP